MARVTGSGRVRRASMRATSTLLLAAQLLALSHLLVVRHTICPEHGEAIHSESPSDAQTLGSSHEGAAADPTLGPGAPAAEHAHDHCLALANPRHAERPVLLLMGASAAAVRALLDQLAPANLTARVGVALVDGRLVGLPWQAP